MKIRKYKPDNYKEIADLFQGAVHSTCANDYSKDELEAWAPYPIDYGKWQKRLSKKKPIVVIIENKIVGFAEVEKDGYIDCFYVHKDYQNQGIGGFLLNHISKTHKDCKRLYAEVSITAKPFFLKHGFNIMKENTVHINSQKLINFLMEKQIELAC